jgi:hypothetical protein
MFTFLRRLPIVFQSGNALGTFPSAMHEGSFFPASSQAFAVVGVLDDRYSNRGVVES